MFVPKLVLYSFAILLMFYIFAYTRDRRQDRKIKGELSWLRLKVEYLSDRENFRSREKVTILKHHPLLKRCYKDYSIADIAKDLEQPGFATTYAYSVIMNVEYTESDERVQNI